MPRALLKDLKRYALENDTNVTAVLVLWKHLRVNIESLRDVEDIDALTYFQGGLFENESTIIELTQASAGVPRDFLRIFVRAFKRAQNHLPINVSDVRMAAHEFFNQEKKHLISGSNEANTLFENIFQNICLNNKNNIFVVSKENSENIHLRDLWRNRLIHMVAEAIPGSAGNKEGTYDVYAIDNGRYVGMTINQKGIEIYTKLKSGSIRDSPFVAFAIDGLLSIPKVERSIMKMIENSIASQIEFGSADVGKILENCTEFLADKYLVHS